MKNSFNSRKELFITSNWHFTIHYILTSIIIRRIQANSYIMSYTIQISNQKYVFYIFLYLLLTMLIFAPCSNKYNFNSFLICQNKLLTYISKSFIKKQQSMAPKRLKRIILLAQINILIIFSLTNIKQLIDLQIEFTLKISIQTKQKTKILKSYIFLISLFAKLISIKQISIILLVIILILPEFHDCQTNMISKNNRTQEVKAKSLSPGKIVSNCPQQLTVKKKTSYKPPLPPSHSKPKLNEQQKLQSEYKHYKNISQTLFFEHNQLQSQYNNLQTKYENELKQKNKIIVFLQGQITNLNNQQRQLEKKCENMRQKSQSSDKQQKGIVEFLYNKNSEPSFFFQKENHQPAIHRLKTDLNTANYEKQRLKEQLNYIQAQNIKQVQQLASKNNYLIGEIAKLKAKQDNSRGLEYQTTSKMDSILVQKYEWQKKKWQEDKQYLQKGIKQIQQSWKNNYERMLKNKQQCTNQNKLLIQKLKVIDNRNYELVRQKNELQAKVTEYEHKMYSLKNSFEHKLNIQLDNLDIRHKQQIQLLKKTYEKKLNDAQTSGYDQGYFACQKNEAKKIQNYQEKIRICVQQKNQLENQIRTIIADKKAMQNSINFLTAQTRKKNDLINQLERQFDQKSREAQNKRIQDIKATRITWQEQIRKQRATLETIQTQIRNNFIEKQKQWKRIMKDAQSTNQQLLQKNKNLRKQVSNFKTGWQESKRQLQIFKDQLKISKFQKQERFETQTCKKDIEKFSQLNEQLRILKEQIKYHTEIEKDLQEANQYKIQSERRVGQYKEEISSLNAQLNEITSKYNRIENQYIALKKKVQNNQSRQQSFILSIQQTSQREKIQSFQSSQLELANLKNQEKLVQLEKLEKLLRQKNQQLQVARNAFCQLQQKIVSIELSLTQSQKMYLEMIEENFRIKSDLQRSQNSSQLFSEQLRRKQQQLQRFIDEHEQLSIHNKMLKSQNEQHNSISLNQTISVQYHQIIKEISEKNLQLEQEKQKLEDQVMRLSNQVQALNNKIERNLANANTNNEIEKRSIIQSLDSKKILIASLQTQIKNMRSTLACRQTTVKQLKDYQLIAQKQVNEKSNLIKQYEKCIEQARNRQKSLKQQNRNLRLQLNEKLIQLEQERQKTKQLLQNIKNQNNLINDLQLQLTKAVQDLQQATIQKIQLQNLQQRQFSSLLQSGYKGQGSLRMHFQQFMRQNNQSHGNISNIIAKKDKVGIKTQTKQKYLIEQNKKGSSLSDQKQNIYLRQDKIVQDTVKILIQGSSSSMIDHQKQVIMNVSQQNEKSQYYFSDITPLKKDIIAVCQPLSEQQHSENKQQ